MYERFCSLFTFLFYDYLSIWSISLNRKKSISLLSNHEKLPFHISFKTRKQYRKIESEFIRLFERLTFDASHGNSINLMSFFSLTTSNEIMISWFNEVKTIFFFDRKWHFSICYQFIWWKSFRCELNLILILHQQISHVFYQGINHISNSKIRRTIGLVIGKVLPYMKFDIFLL